MFACFLARLSVRFFVHCLFLCMFFQAAGLHFTGEPPQDLQYLKVCFCIAVWKLLNIEVIYFVLFSDKYVSKWGCWDTNSRTKIVFDCQLRMPQQESTWINLISIRTLIHTIPTSKKMKGKLSKCPAKLCRPPSLSEATAELDSSERADGTAYGTLRECPSTSTDMWQESTDMLCVIAMSSQ